VGVSARPRDRETPLRATALCQAAFKLADSQMSSTGVAIHAYERAGDVQYGSFALE
jgi:hypothetical protein